MTGNESSGREQRCTKLRADILALKHAQSLHGADRAVYQVLERSEVVFSVPLPGVSEFCLVETKGAIAAESVLFLGVKPLETFNYPEIRKFAKDVFVILADKAPNIRHLGLTT